MNEQAFRTKALAVQLRPPCRAETMADIGSYLPSPGSAVWRRDVATPPSDHPHVAVGGGSRGDSNRVRHVVIRDAEIWEEPAPYVVS